MAGRSSARGPTLTTTRSRAEANSNSTSETSGGRSSNQSRLLASPTKTSTSLDKGLRRVSVKSADRRRTMSTAVRMLGEMSSPRRCATDGPMSSASTRTADSPRLLIAKVNAMAASVAPTPPDAPVTATIRSSGPGSFGCSGSPSAASSLVGHSGAGARPEVDLTTIRFRACRKASALASASMTPLTPRSRSRCLPLSSSGS